MHQKGLVPILVLLVFTLLAGFVIYQKQTTSPAPKPSEQPKVVDETVYTEALRSANWKTYTNTKYGYGISYPSEWEAQQNSSEWLYLKNKDMYISVSVVEKTKATLEEEAKMQGQVYPQCSVGSPCEFLPAKQLLKKQNSNLKEFYEIINADGKKLVIFSIPINTGYYIKIASFPESKFFNDVPEALFNQILSTFKFTDSNTQNHVLLPIQDLAKKLGVKEEDITLVSVEETEWSDSSLGCPKEGQFYAQVITPGYKVILSYNHPLAEFQKTYEYHADKKGNFTSCSN